MHNLMLWHESHDIVVEQTTDHYYISFLTYHLTAPLGDDGGFNIEIDMVDETPCLCFRTDDAFTTVPLSLLFDHGYRILFMKG